MRASTAQPTVGNTTLAFGDAKHHSLAAVNKSAYYSSQSAQNATKRTHLWNVFVVFKMTEQNVDGLEVERSLFVLRGGVHFER